jgi:predicted nucleic acid-binding protein
MPVALLDTNVLFASASARDEYHDAAADIVQAVDHGTLPDATVTDYVLAETLNLAREKLGAEISIRLLDRLVAAKRFTLERATRADFDAGRSLFREYPPLSFVDATIVAYMRRMDLEYLYSFDDDFDAVDGITRLTTADSPF